MKIKSNKNSFKAIGLLIGSAVVAFIGQLIVTQQMRLDIEEEMNEMFEERFKESPETEDEA